MKVIFLINKYSALFDVALSIVGLSSPSCALYKPLTDPIQVELGIRNPEVSWILRC